MSDHVEIRVVPVHRVQRSRARNITNGFFICRYLNFKCLMLRGAYAIMNVKKTKLVQLNGYYYHWPLLDRYIRFGFYFFLLFFYFFFSFIFPSSVHPSIHLWLAAVAAAHLRCCTFSCVRIGVPVYGFLLFFSLQGNATANENNREINKKTHQNRNRKTTTKRRSFYARSKIAASTSVCLGSCVCVCELYKINQKFNHSNEHFRLKQKLRNPLFRRRQHIVLVESSSRVGQRNEK